MVEVPADKPWGAQTQPSLESNHYLVRYHEGGSKKTFDLVMCNLANRCKLERMNNVMR